MHSSFETFGISTILINMYISSLDFFVKGSGYVRLVHNQYAYCSAENTAQFGPTEILISLSFFFQAILKF